MGSMEYGPHRCEVVLPARVWTESYWCHKGQARAHVFWQMVSSSRQENMVADMVIPCTGASVAKFFFDA